MKLYDISRTIRPTTAVWPGDTPYRVEPVLRLEEGQSVNLTTITLSPHTGTHADAYFHYEADGEHPDMMPLKAYIGRAWVASVNKRDGELTPEDFRDVRMEGVERLLIHSYVSDLPDDQWPDKFPYLSVELIVWLSAFGVQLIGLDSPSVDEFTSKELPCHHALRRHHMVNLELLNLRGVPDGEYAFAGLPLKLDFACASPVRAVLWREE